jgi:phytoene dehydrogenase-like protein
MPELDVVIVGAGPNGLAAAIELARAGKSVAIYEAKDTIGGGVRTQELTLPGFQHDVCSAIHPLGVGSPFFKSLPLEALGVEWIYPEANLAHPFDDGTAVQLFQSLEASAAQFEPKDAQAYTSLMKPFAERWEDLAADILGPLPLPPKHPFLMARFGLNAMRSAEGLAKYRFKNPKLQALFLGMAGHSCIQLDRIMTASFGMVLGILGHAVGWAIPKGGSQMIVNAMAAYLESLGGEIFTSQPIERLEQLPPARAVLFDLTAKQLLKIAAERFSPGYRAELERFRYGPGVFKMDFALSEPIPWTAPQCHRAGTVHLGASLEEIVLSEQLVWENKHSDRPLVLVGQQSLFDASRAPQGKHTGWAYCHVPHGSDVDMSELVLRQIERFAPGFRDTILATHSMNALEMNRYNSNYVGGDINGGVQDIWQLFTRPVFRLVPYRSSSPDLYLCSSSTPPGGGVHGMCGYHAAKVVLRDCFKS